jgi:PAS domain S-box-containing protein
MQPLRSLRPKRPQAREPTPLPEGTPPFEQCFARLPGIVFVLDDHASILYANRPVVGLEPSALLGQDFKRLVAPEHQDRVDAAVRDTFHPGVAQTLELPIASRDGVSWYQADIAPMTLPGMRAAILFGTDISARRREEQRLRRAEQLMVDTQGITHLGTWTWDISEPHAQWSQELYRIYGLDPKAHTPSYQDYLTRIHPDDVERVKAATEAVFKEHIPYSHDERIRRPDGSWRWLHTWAYPVLDAKGNLVALAGVCQDITEARTTEHALQASEARLRALFDHTLLGLAILDGDGSILEANAALASMCGLQAQALTGRKLEEILDPRDGGKLASDLRALANPSDKLGGRRLEAHLLRPHPRTSLPVRVDLARIRSDPSPFLFAIVQDAMSEAKAVEADRLAFTRLLEIRKLEKMSEQRSQLLRVASHEIKNPLTPVMVQLHILEKGLLGPLEPKQQHAVHIASRQVQRISHLLRDVLDVARIDQGRLAVQAIPVELKSVARRVHESYERVAKEWGITLTTRGDPALLVPGDPARLEQVVTNLVTNALKFTPTGGQVTVECSREGGEAVLRVTDTGSGMDAAQVARIFQPFSQVHEPGQAREEGSGLGLYICQSLMQAMSGRIEVASEKGKGSTFTMRMPALEDDRHATA